MSLAPPLCPTCGQPAGEALGGPAHEWECRNEACSDLGQAIRADEPAAVEPIALEPVDALTITTLVDNVTDILLVDEGPAKRWPLVRVVDPRVPARFLDGGKTGDALRAEHGFSCLVTVEKGGRTARILFDAGLTPDGLVENMRRLELSPRDIDIIVLSHGHWDHTTGMDGIVRELGRPNVPVLIHPAFWNRRRIAIPGREPVELPSTSKPALEGAGFEIVEQQQPSFLLDGSLLVTGEVDRTTEFEKGFPIHQALRHDGWQPDPQILDDQALVANVRGRGLVVLTGCGHGWRAIHAIAARLPDAFIQNSVGTRLELTA